MRRLNTAVLWTVFGTTTLAFAVSASVAATRLQSGVNLIGTAARVDIAARTFDLDVQNGPSYHISALHTIVTDGVHDGSLAQIKDGTAVEVLVVSTNKKTMDADARQIWIMNAKQAKALTSPTITPSQKYVAPPAPRVKTTILDGAASGRIYRPRRFTLKATNGQTYEVGVSHSIMFINGHSSNFDKLADGATAHVLAYSVRGSQAEAYQINVTQAEPATVANNLNTGAAPRVSTQIATQAPIKRGSIVTGQITGTTGRSLEMKLADGKTVTVDLSRAILAIDGRSASMSKLRAGNQASVHVSGVKGNVLTASQVEATTK